MLFSVTIETQERRGRGWEGAVWAGEQREQLLRVAGRLRPEGPRTSLHWPGKGRGERACPGHASFKKFFNLHLRVYLLT